VKEKKMSEVNNNDNKNDNNHNKNENNRIEEGLEIFVELQKQVEEKIEENDERNSQTRAQAQSDKRPPKQRQSQEDDNKHRVDILPQQQEEEEEEEGEWLNIQLIGKKVVLLRKSFESVSKSKLLNKHKLLATGELFINIDFHTFMLLHDFIVRCVCCVLLIYRFID